MSRPVARHSKLVSPFCETGVLGFISLDLSGRSNLLKRPLDIEWSGPK